MPGAVKYTARVAWCVLAMGFVASVDAGGSCEPIWEADIGQPGFNDWVTALTEFEGDLIAGGSFTSPATRAARWTGSNWEPLGSLNSGIVWTFSIYDGELVAAGTFTADGVSTLNRIARWDSNGPNGAGWYPVASAKAGTVGMNSIVRALVIYDGTLIAGGAFTEVEGQPINYIASWNGATWQEIGGGMNVDGVHALTVYKGDLIAAGNFSFAGDTPVNRIARWDGSTWHSLGTGLNDVVTALTTFDGDLIASGVFSQAGGSPASGIARWDGVSWHQLGDGLNAEAIAFATMNGELIAGGSFTTAGGMPANRIARWDGSNWLGLADGTGGSAVFCLAVLGQRLVVGGTFTTVGSKLSANRIAEVLWSGASPAVLQSPVSMLLAVGATAVFEVTDNGLSGINYQWRRDGVDLVDGENIVGTNTATLTISNVSLDDFGAYDVRISNACGSVVSSPAALGIEFEPANNCPADMVSNITFQPPGDGVVDAADLAFLLGEWGACK